MIPTTDTPTRTDDLLYETCKRCSGEGIIEGERWEEGVGDYAALMQCPDCEGSGKVLREYEKEDDV